MEYWWRRYLLPTRLLRGLIFDLNTEMKDDRINVEDVGQKQEHKRRKIGLVKQIQLRKK